MVEKAAGGGNGTAVLESFGTYLIGEIDSGSYAAEKNGWVSCADIGNAEGCALEWYILPSHPYGFVPALCADGSFITGPKTPMP